MPRFRQRFALSCSGCALLVAVSLVAWAMGPGSSEAEQDAMHNCPQPGKWAISVWDGADGTETGEALAACGADAVDVAYALDPQTGGWLGWFRGRPEISKLLTLNGKQGVLALGRIGAAPPTPTPEPTPGAGEGAMHNCPQAGKWAISVWDGPDGTETGEALATCGEGTVDVAYALDPQTGGWLGWFEGRPEITKLLTLDGNQGVLALGRIGAPLPTPTARATPGGTPAPTPGAWEIQTPVATLIIKELELADRFPPDCDLAQTLPPCQLAGEGYQVLVVWLERKDGGDPGQVIDELRGLAGGEELHVIGGDGSRTGCFAGGLMDGKLFVAFTPPASAHDLRLFWPGNPPIDLGI